MPRPTPKRLRTTRTTLLSVDDLCTDLMHIQFDAMPLFAYRCDIIGGVQCLPKTTTRCKGNHTHTHIHIHETCLPRDRVKPLQACLWCCVLSIPAMSSTKAAPTTRAAAHHSRPGYRY